MIKSHHIESLRPESVFQNIGGIIGDFDHHWETTFMHNGRSEGDSRWSHLLTSANAIYLPIVTRNRGCRRAGYRKTYLGLSQQLTIPLFHHESPSPNRSPDPVNQIPSLWRPVIVDYLFTIQCDRDVTHRSLSKPKIERGKHLAKARAFGISLGICWGYFRACPVPVVTVVIYLKMATSKMPRPIL